MVIENSKVQLVEQNDMSHYGHVVFPEEAHTIGTYSFCVLTKI